MSELKAIFVNINFYKRAEGDICKYRLHTSELKAIFVNIGFYSTSELRTIFVKISFIHIRLMSEQKVRTRKKIVLTQTAPHPIPQPPCFLCQ